MSNFRNVTTTPIDYNLDLAGRQRISDPYNIFDSKLLTGKGDLLWDEEIITGVGSPTSTHSPTNASVTMTVTGNGDAVIRQTKMRFDYQPGKTQRILMTGVLGAPVASTFSAIGYYNSTISTPFATDFDGVLFQSGSSDVTVYIYKLGSGVSAAQSAWNLDRMDGSGGTTNPSGITVDWDEEQVFVIEFLWLGVDTVRFGLKIGGKIYYVHQFSFPNGNITITGAYTSQPNHSLRYELRSFGGTKSMTQICGSVQSEGGTEPSGVNLGLDMGATPTGNVAASANAALIGYRLKTTNYCTTVIPQNISIACPTAGDFLWQLRLNPTVAGTFTYADVTNSGIQKAQGLAANTVTGGFVLASGYSTALISNITLGVESILRPGVAIDGTRDEIVLVVTNVDSTSESFLGSITLRELYCGS